MSVRVPRRGLALPRFFFAVLGFLILFGLGTWQIERKAWKAELIGVLQQRASAAPIQLPPRAEWSTPKSTSDEFRRVTFRAEFIHTQEAYVYTVGSSLRPDISGVGYWVFTPAKISDGSIVVVNRGFIPENRLDTHTRIEGQVLDAVDIVGALRWSEARGLFTPNDDPNHNVWYVRDHLAIAAAKGWGDVAPFFIDQEAPLPPGGLPQAGRLSVQLRNEHLQYALTWYGLAAVLVVVFTLWERGRSRAGGIKT